MENFLELDFSFIDFTTWNWAALKKTSNIFCLKWLKTVSRTYIWMGRYNHSLTLDSTIMVSKICSIISEHVVIIFLTQ